MEHSPLSIIAFFHILIVCALSNTITSLTQLTTANPDNLWNSFYNAETNKIHGFGVYPQPKIFDPKTNQWSSDAVVSTNAEQTNPTSSTVVNGVYYSLDVDDTNNDIIHKFDPKTSSYTYTANWLNLPTGFDYRGCITSDGVDTLYLMSNQNFGRIKVNAAVISLKNGKNMNVNSVQSQCAYYSGYVYLFGGDSHTKVLKINVDNFDTAQWEELSISTPSDFFYGTAVLAGNELIYIGGFAYAAGIYSFDPNQESNGLTAVSGVTGSRTLGNLLWSETDSKLYIVSMDHGVEVSNTLSKAWTNFVNSEYRLIWMMITVSALTTLCMVSIFYCFLKVMMSGNQRKTVKYQKVAIGDEVNDIQRLP